jgi:hypothetical protein
MIISLGIVALFIFIAVGAVFYWEWLKDGESNYWQWLNDGESNSATLRNLGLIVFGSIGFALAAWRTRIAERNTEFAAKNVEIADRNSVTDTFTKAIEQLGASSQDKPNIEVRLGAIYALEKLSQSNDDYYQAIIDILCSYVRQNSPTTEDNKALRIDVQTAMTVIGKRSVKVDEMHLDLSYTNLQDADLEKADLAHAFLAHANLGGAYLEGAYGKPLVS